MKPFAMSYRKFFSVLLLFVFLLGNVASGYAKYDSSKSFSKTELSKGKAFGELSVFVNDAILINIPAYSIGCYQYVYNLKTDAVKKITPVAHAPPTQLNRAS